MSAQSQSAPKGQIRGAVRDTGGTPVPGAAITLVPRISAAYAVTPGPGFAGFRAQAQAGRDGTFQAADLPSGVYDICVSSPGSDLLGDCDWTVRPNAVVVRPGGTETANVSLKRGQWLSVRVLDPEGHIAKAARPRVGIEISAPGLNPKTLLEPVQQGTGLVYNVLIPEEVDLDIDIRAKGLKLADSNGRALDNGTARLKHRARAGVRTQDLNLRVTGVISPADRRSPR